MRTPVAHALALLLAAMPFAAAAQWPILPPVGRPLAQAPARPSPFPAIAVLLPLSGEYRSFGEPCLRGIRLALGAGDVTPASRTIVLDTRGIAAEAAAAFQRAAADPSVVAVLGPMLSWELDAVRLYAVRHNLLTVSFSQRSVPPGGPILPFSMSREDQARALARYALVERGLARWAILHPDDSYGRDLSLRFRVEVERLGGRIVAAVAYDRSKVDFRTDVERLRGRLAIGEGESPPIDGVFLPDSAEKVALLLPYLAYFEIRGVQLLGTNGWSRIETLRKATPEVNGAVFVDGFFLHSFAPGVRSFVDSYRDEYGDDPGILEAHGYDAATLIERAVTAGARDRARMVHRFQQPFFLTGATGEVRFRPGEGIARSLFLIEVADGALREIETRAVVDGAELPGSGREWRRPEWDSRSADAYFR